MHFHPDALFGGTSTLNAMAESGIYRSQFETHTSNGGLTAHPGGDRWNWESRIFGGVYDNGPASDRPKYGALNYRDDPYGGSPRFGSCFLVLAEHVLDRCTFCFPDSVFEPRSFGTAERNNLVNLASSTHLDDPLDRYIEAHVHGRIDVARDAQALVLDPSYRGTAVADAAHALDCPLLWHDGYRATVDTIAQHADYRGAHIVEVARTIAHDGELTPHTIGLARHSTIDPQHLKRVWHYVARFGRAPLS
jgi:hypothetical protein